MSTESIREVLFDIAPELVTVDVAELARIDRFISRATNRLNVTGLGDKYDEAAAYLVAHQLTRSATSTSSAGGTVTKEKVGDVEITYSAGSSSSSLSDYSSTKYGQEFQSILKTCYAGPRLLNLT
jgi:hypothetical protein